MVKKSKWQTIDIEVEMEIGPDDIEVIFTDPDDCTQKQYMRQLNDVAIFLKGTPDSMIKTFTKAQVDVICAALWDISDRFVQTQIDAEKEKDDRPLAKDS